MKIKKEKNKVEFKDVEIGQIFEHDEKLYLKIVRWSDEYYDFSMLNLETYDLEEDFDSHVLVSTYNDSELIIK